MGVGLRLKVMEEIEYENIAKVEKGHWYYQAKRLIAAKWIDRTMGLRKSTRVLDCGAGTGEFAVSISNRYDTYAMDALEPALDYLRKRLAADRVLKLLDGGIDAAEGSFDVITALDVLEHIENTGPAIAEMRRCLKVGGVLIATVPARAELWSDWDVSLHHFRRYDRSMLRREFAAAEWEVIHLNYTNPLSYLPALIVRKFRTIWGHSDAGRSRLEDRIPPKAINIILRNIFYWSGVTRLPILVGVSLIVIAVKLPQQCK
jgi:2-polyprenyl-3-methyl-5-hydroxy-6-metoxy-1,4-benzoquinol methylase